MNNTYVITIEGAESCVIICRAESPALALKAVAPGYVWVEYAWAWLTECGQLSANVGHYVEAWQHADDLALNDEFLALLRR